MNPLRSKQIRTAILQALIFASGYALPAETLRTHVDALQRPPLTDEEWEANIQWLESTHRIIRVPSDMDETLVQFSITERGRVLHSTL